jgi:hypothetical protein
MGLTIAKVTSHRGGLNMRKAGHIMLSTLLSAGVALGLTGCRDNADADGDGKVSTSERSTEMQRDGYLPMTAGRWQTTVTFASIDAPELSPTQRAKIFEAIGKEMVGYNCLSKEQAAQPGPDFFAGAGKENCTYQRFDVAGTRADMALSCKMGAMGRVDMDLSGTAEAATMDFDTKVIVHLPMIGKARKISMAGKMSGKYLGACSGDE